MGSAETLPRPFEPGTTGWSASDLDDPQIEHLWFDGRYEIVDGVLTTKPPTYLAAGESLAELLFVCRTHVRDSGLRGRFAMEVDIIIDDARVAVADAVYMSADDQRRQKQAFVQSGRSDPQRTRILVPPTLIVESVSPGHEKHDQRTKLRWYAEFGVPNYWILDAFEKSLTCWVLEGSSYRPDAAGNGSDEVPPSLFPGLTISLAQIWGE